MRIRPDSMKDLKKHVPGPGQYNVREDKDMQKPSYRFGKDQKIKDPNFTYMKNPGPGNYEFVEDLKTSTAPKFSFGKEMRGDDKRPNTPGPGQYNYKNSIGETGPKISMSFVRPMTATGSKDKLSVPGVGQYTLNMNTHTKAPQFK